MSAFEGFPTLDALGAELARLAAAERAAPSRVARSRRRSLALAFALVLGLAATAAAGTLLVLRGSVIPAPAPVDVGRAQVPLPETTHVLPLVAADPAGGPPWALRVADSQTGLVCSTVGQVVGGTFGLIGLDGRFRAFAPAVVDGCGARQENATSLLGARVFDARRAADVRTVVNGVGGEQLREVTVQAAGTTSRPEVGPGGTYVLALRGYPEDIGIVVVLRFADGHVERHPLGTDESVVADPAGGPAWRTEAYVIDQQPQHCVDFRPARQETADSPLSPAACGRPGPAHGTKQDGLFFAVRRVGGICGHGRDALVAGRWCHHPARTAVWGFAGSNVSRVVVVAGGERRDVTIGVAKSFLAVLAPSVDPASIRVEVRYADGHARTFRGDTNLVDPPRLG